MPFVSPKKSNELEYAISNRHFPLIVHGPSGTGKTRIIKELLCKHGMKCVEVDLSNTVVRRPLSRDIIVLATLYETADLKNIQYGANLIIESNLHYLNKMDGFRTIRLNRTGKQSAILNSNKSITKNSTGRCLGSVEQQELVDLYQFIGKIFYRKLSIKQLEMSGRMLYYTAEGKESRAAHASDRNNDGGCRIGVSVGTKAKIDKPEEDGGGSRDRSSRASNKAIGAADDEGASRRAAGKRAQISSADALRRRSVMESSDSEHRDAQPLRDRVSEYVIPSSSAGYKSAMSNENIPNESAHKIISPSRTARQSGGPVTRDKLEGVSVVCFDKNKILGYIYQNITDFLDISSLSPVLDCISQCDHNDSAIFTLIQSIRQLARPPGRRIAFCSIPSDIYRLIQ